MTVAAPDGVVDVQRWGSEGMERLTPLWMLKYLPNMPACHVTIVHGAQGPSNTMTCGETGSMLAITEAARVVERGDADACLAGGTEDRIHPVQLDSICRSGSGKACHLKTREPCLAKAAAVLIVESLEHRHGPKRHHPGRSPASPEDNRPTAPAMVACPKMIPVHLSHGTGDGRCGVSAQDIDEVITSASGVHSDHAEQARHRFDPWLVGAGHSHHHPRQNLWQLWCGLGCVGGQFRRAANQPRPSTTRLGVCHRPRRTARRVGFGGSCMTRQVVVTGMGWITPLGQDLDTVWSALISGQSGIKPTTRFDASTFPTRIAGQVADSFDWTQSVRDSEQHEAQVDTRPTRTPPPKHGVWLDSTNHRQTRIAAVSTLGGRRSLDFVATCRSHMSGVRDEAYDWPTWGKTAQQAYSREFEAEQEPFAPARHLRWNTTCADQRPTA